MNMLNLNKSKAVLITAILSVAITACGSPDGYNSKSAEGTAPPPVVSNAPTVILSALSTSVAYGGGTTVSWTSTNATSCTSSGGGGTGTAGSFSTGSLTTTTTYVVTCAGAGGSTSQGMTITVAPSVITGFVNAGGAGNITATSSNDLTSGMIITISGTTDYNGTYTVISATSTSFVIQATWVSASQTGTWQLAGGMLAGCSTSGNTSAITLSNVPSRFNGVAPLSVFFDASTTTATSTTRPYHDLEYRWDFGDAAGSPVSGTTWATTGARAGVSSRNAATGPGAGHVFESPGTYTVNLTVTDGTNTVTNNCARIVVQDPEAVFAGTNTICVSTSGTFTDCPVGATNVTSSNFTSAINTYTASNRRVLFRRGETFTGASSGILDVNGPGIIGAYGTGTKPIVNGPGTAPVITLGTYGSGLYTDWRIMDLNLNGQNNQAGENVGIGAVGQFNQVTILRVDVVGTSTGYAASHWTLTSGQQSFDQWAIHDSTAAGVPNCNWTGHYICNWRIYVVGTRWSMQGNTLDNLGNPSTLYAGGSHVIRTEMLQNSVISNNTLRGAGDFQVDIKLHAWAWGGGAGGNATAGTYTEKVIIADNKIEGGANTWYVSLGPQDEISDERVRDVILERNWFTANSRTQVPMHINSSQTTIRNNICNLSGAAYHTCVNVSRWGITPEPSDTQIYNNTFYSGAGTADFVGVEIATATNTIVRNNLVSAPSSASPVIISGTGTGLVSSNNLLNNTPSDVFVSATPSATVSFGLKSLPNLARDTGLSTVPVLSDFFLTARTQNGVVDIGAVEGP